MSEHSIDAIGSDLDRTLRTTLMLVGQLVERTARRSAARTRASDDATRRALNEGQAGARRLFLPLTLDQRAAQRVDPQVLAQGLQAARQWAALDPVAAVAADYLQEQWQQLYPQRSPEAAATREASSTSTERMIAARARELAATHAPSYYDTSVVSDAQLVADWTTWSETKHLPQDSVRRHWATHLRRDSEVEAAGNAAVSALEGAPSADAVAQARAAAETAALDTIWASSSTIDEARARELAAEYAPPYYTAPEGEQLVQNWQAFIREGELPLASRQLAWATWSSKEDLVDGLEGEERAAALTQIWDEGRAERGALEYAASVAGVESAAQDLAEQAPRAAQGFARAAESLSGTLPTPTEVAGDLEHAAQVFRPMLDPEAFAAADPAQAGRAWLAAHVWSSSEPEAAAALAQLDAQYLVRFGESAQTQLGLSNEPATEGTSRSRILDLTEQAHQFYAQQYPGSASQTYLRDRFGPSVDQNAGLSLGHAPGTGRALVEHLSAAGATETELVDAGLARVGRGDELYDIFRDRALVAVRDGDDQVVGFSGRDLTSNPRAPKYLNTPATAAFDKSTVVLGLSEARDADRVVRVEGALDVVAVNLAGEGRVAGVATMGTSLSPTQAATLAQRSPDGVQVSYLDSDAAGLRGTEHEVTALAAHEVSSRTLSITENDPAQQWASNPERLRQALTAPPTALLPAGVDLIGRDLAQAQWEHPEGRVAALKGAARHVAAAPAQDQETLMRTLVREYQDAYNASHPARPLTSPEAVEAVSVAVRDGKAPWASGTAWTDTLADAVADMSTAAHELPMVGGREAPAATYDRAAASQPVDATEEATRSRERAAAGFTRSTLDGVDLGAAVRATNVRTSRPSTAPALDREDTLSM